MSNIEDIIRKNKSSFFNEDPPAGHLDRFQQRLSNKNHFLWPVLRVAAIVVLILSISLALYYQDVARDISVSTISTELAETEMYYQSMLNHKLNHVKNMLNDQQYTSIKQELKVMDRNFHYLKEDLKLNPDDQRIIHAMINNYQLKIELVQQVIDQVKYNNNIKSVGYDTEQS